jgi:transposase
MKPFTNSGQFRKGDPKLKIKTASHRKAISKGQRLAWRTKRARMPIGSTWIDAGGYVRVKVVEGAGRWKLQHVMVMERRLGRKLMVSEIVHHVDGDRQNNADDNLYLCRDHKHHMEVARQLKETFRALLKRGIVTFSQALGVYACH